jgi:hypothetical protein
MPQFFVQERPSTPPTEAEIAALRRGTLMSTEVGPRTATLFAALVLAVAAFALIASVVAVVRAYEASPPTPTPAALHR